MWVHADGFSSPHGYIRLPFDPEVAAAAAAAAQKGTKRGEPPFIPPLPEIPPEVLEDCCQLIKEGSIKGCKEASLPMIYMPAANLKKTADMDTGAVGHWREDRVKKCVVARRDPAALRRLERTKEEVARPDLAGERAAFEAAARGERQAQERRRREEDKAGREEQRRLDDLRSYKTLLGGGAMAEGATTNAEMREKYASAEDYEDDFM